MQEIIDEKVDLVQPVDYAEYVDEYGDVNEVNEVKEKIENQTLLIIETFSLDSILFIT